MRNYISTTIAISFLLIATGCSTNGASSNQTVQQRQACTSGDPHPWCMQMAQTRPLGSAPYGLGPDGRPINREMQDDDTPYPINRALPLGSPGIGSLNLGGISR